MKIVTTVCLDPELYSMAKAQNINLSRLLETSLKLKLELDTNKEKDELTALKEQNLKLASQLEQLQRDNERLANDLEKTLRELNKYREKVKNLEQAKTRIVL